MTHSLSALRKTLLNGATLAEVSHELVFLAVFTAVVWPLGVLAFQMSLRRSQSDGTLGHY